MGNMTYNKIKTAEEVKSALRHCDVNTRFETNYHNTDEPINEELTKLNWQIRLVMYEKACREYDERIAVLDKHPRANKRNDRVSCIDITVSYPAVNTELKPILREEGILDWFSRVWDITVKQYDEENMIEGYVHFDEQRLITDPFTGDTCMSTPHMHMFIIPVHNGRLLAYERTSKYEKYRLAQAIHKMSAETLDMEFIRFWGKREWKGAL